MYCIRCGAKLADSEKSCPLCGTRVYHPDLQQPEGRPLYPRDQMPAQPGRSLVLQGSLTILFVLAGAIAALCNQQISGKITWSGFIMGGLALSYVIMVLPMWFRRPNPVIFVPCGFAAVLGMLLYVCLATGGKWFMSFAFPVAGGMGLIVTASVTLLRYIHRGRLFIAGGTCLALGGFMLMIELLLIHTFPFARFTGWSLYPLAVLVLIGGFLIFLGICRPAREMMARKFFI